MIDIVNDRRKKIDDQYAGAAAVLGKAEGDPLKKEGLAGPLASTFVIVGCITYSYRNGNAFGQTAFILGVDRPCQQSPVGKCAFDVSRARMQVRPM